MTRIAQIKLNLQEIAGRAEKRNTMFYKTGPGQYAEHDRFMGVTVPTLRKIAKEYDELSLAEIQLLLDSSFNEERFLALVILINLYKRADTVTRDQLYQFYLDNLGRVNNWNLVDLSAHEIIGAQLLDTNKSLLVTLASSEIMWERRIAIVATWQFIRKHNLVWTFKIAEMLINDQHDLIHKATGWMLREAGKKDEAQLRCFLNQYRAEMPRTMLRYAIEKFSLEERKAYL